MALVDRPLTAADFQEVPWRDCIASADRRECWSYSRLFFDEARRCAEAGDEKGKAVFEFFGKVCSMMLRPEDRAAPFQPQVVLTTGRSAIPDDLSREEIDALGQLYPHVEDAELRARCADLVWVLASEHRAARVAVDAYYELASQPDGRWYERATRLRRAVALAAALGKRGELYQDLLSRLDQLLDAEWKAGNTDFGCALMEILRDCGGGDARKLAEWCDQAARSIEEGPSANDTRRFLRLAADWYGVAGDQPARESVWRRTAETHLADGKRARASENPMAAVRHYESAIEVMRRLRGGARERVDEIRRELAEVQEAALGQMRRISTPFDVSEMVRRAQEAVSGKALGEALETLALAGKAPAIEQLRKDVERLAGQFPLKHLIAMVVVDGLGRKLGERGPLDPRDANYERSLDIEMFQHTSFYRRLHVVGVVEPMRQTIVNEHRMTEAALLPLLESNPFVPNDRVLLFARGLSAGFQTDYLVASHILIPQIENSLRKLLADCGEAVTSMDAEGVEELFALDRVLAHPRTVEILGQDAVFDLRGLLVEKTSTNLRHRMAHGLMSDADFLTTDAAYLWWVTLRLCMIPVVYRRRAARGDKSASGHGDSDSGGNNV